MKNAPTTGRAFVSMFLGLIPGRMGLVFMALMCGLTAHANIVLNTNSFNFSTVTLWNIDGVGGNEAQSNGGDSERSLDIYAASNSFGVVTMDAGGIDPMLNLTLASLVDGNLHFRSGSARTEDPEGDLNGIGFADGTPGYIGFRFTPAGTTLYGWAEVVRTDLPSKDGLTVMRWGYEDSGNPILVGAVPEPSSIALFLGAGAMIFFYRRKRVL